LIRDETDLARHVDYVHWNPVKHGHVAQALDWPYSTLHRSIRDEVLRADWDDREHGMGFCKRGE
jgi:putative transposase